jgi:hypothetical protein
MARDDLTSSTDERQTGVPERDWDGVERDLGTHSSGDGEGEARCLRNTRDLDVTPRLSLPSYSVRLAVMGTLLALAAALLLIVIPAVVGNDPAGQSAPSKTRHRPAVTSDEARRIGERRPVQPGHRPGRHQAKRERGGGAKRETRGRRGTRRPSHSTQGQPTPSIDSHALGAPVAPPPPSSVEPAPPPAEQPRGKEGLADGSRSSPEFGL